MLRAATAWHVASRIVVIIRMCKIVQARKRRSSSPDSEQHGAEDRNNTMDAPGLEKCSPPGA